MSNNAQSNVQIIFEGRAQSLDLALKSMREQLGVAGTEATTTGEKLGKLSEGEAKTAREARNLGEAVKIAADSVGLLGLEAGESVGKLYLARDAAGDFARSMGGMKSALIGGIGLGVAFAGMDLLREGVKEAIAGEQATDQLRAALIKVPGAFALTSKAIEEGTRTWAHFGIAVGTLKAAIAQGVGAGIKPETIIGQPAQIADLAKALGEDIPSALGEIERGGRGADRVISRLNLSLVDQRRAMQQLANPNFSANDRTQFLLNLVEKTQFKGQGEAGTTGAAGAIREYDASMANLRETIGTDIVPLVTDVAKAISGTAQSADSALAGFGGLAHVLTAIWKPALIGIGTLMLGLKLSHSQLGDFIRSRLLGDVSAAAGGFAEEAGQATRAGDAIAAIPPVARTVALFDATAASALKDLYLGNLSRIPGALIPGEAVTPQPVTVPAFVPAEAEAALGGYKGELATIPTTVTTTPSFVGGVLPLIAVGAVATVGTVAFASGALKPVTDALGNLTGHVASWTAAAFTETVQTAGHVTSWVAAPFAQPANAVGHVASWVYDTPIAPSSIVAHVQAWALDTPLPNPQAVSVHIARWIMDAVPQPGAVPGHIGTWILDQRLPNPQAVSAHIGRWIFDTVPGTVQNLTGAITHWYTSPGPSLHDLTATISHWAFGGGATPHVDVPGTAVVGGVTMKAGTIASITGAFTVGRVVLPSKESVSVTGTAKLTSFSLPTGTTFTATGKGEVTSLTVKKGTTIQVGGAAEINSVRVKQGLTISNVHGTVQIDNATVAPGKKLTVGNVGGTAIIENVVPAPGKRLVIEGVHGNAVIDGVTLKHGATVHVSGGSATVDTLNAKAVKIDGGALPEAMGFGKNHPLPLYFKPELAPGTKWPTGPASGTNGGSGGGADWTGMIESAVVFAVVGRLVGAGGSAGIGKAKGLFDQFKGPKPPTSGGAATAIDEQLTLAEKDAQDTARRQAEATARKARQKPADPSQRTLTPPTPHTPQPAAGKPPVYVQNALRHPAPHTAKPPTNPITATTADGITLTLAGPIKLPPAQTANIGNSITSGLAGFFKHWNKGAGIIGNAIGDAFANVKSNSFVQYNVKLAGLLAGVVAGGLALLSKAFDGGGVGAGATIIGPKISGKLAAQFLEMAGGLIQGLTTGIKAKLGDLVNVGKWIVDAIKAGITGHAPKPPNTSNPTGDPHKLHLDGHGGYYDAQGRDHKGKPPPGWTSDENGRLHPPPPPGGTAGLGSAGHITAGLAPINTAMLHAMGALATTPAHPALHREMQRHMARVSASPHAPVHHQTTTHHTETHHQTVHVTIVEAKTPRDTGDAVLKALSTAAQRKTKHGR